MSDWMKKYDMNVFLSNDYRDVNFARKIGVPVKKTVIIPNGAGADEFLDKSKIYIRQRLGIPNDHFLILHVGSHTGVKGHKEAIEIFSRAKIRNSTLFIVGNVLGGGCSLSCQRRSFFFNLSPRRWLDSKRLIVTSLSRNETVASYQAADLFLFPSNIECSPIVLFEAMASKTPFLTSDVGNSVEIVGWSRGAGIVLPTDKDKKGYVRFRILDWILDSARTLKKIFFNSKPREGIVEAGWFSRVRISESVKILEDIFQDSERREKMAESGFEVWKMRFTWEKIARQYENLYRGLVKNDYN
jgi:glycosyltransferase involved in cell wall biosynthesis